MVMYCVGGAGVGTMVGWKVGCGGGGGGVGGGMEGGIAGTGGCGMYGIGGGGGIGVVEKTGCWWCSPGNISIGCTFGGRVYPWRCTSASLLAVETEMPVVSLIILFPVNGVGADALEVVVARLRSGMVERRSEVEVPVGVEDGVPSVVSGCWRPCGAVDNGVRPSANGAGLPWSRSLRLEVLLIVELGSDLPALGISYYGVGMKTIVKATVWASLPV